MKKLRILAILFILSCFLPVMNTMAAGHISFLTVEIPGNSSDWYYSGFGYNKTKVSYQYYHNGGATNALGSEVDIQVRTWDGKNNSTWLTTPKGKYVTWGESNGSMFNFNVGTYGLDIHRKTTGLKLTHSGTWYYNTVPANL